MHETDESNPLWHDGPAMSKILDSKDFIFWGAWQILGHLTLLLVLLFLLCFRNKDLLACSFNSVLFCGQFFCSIEFYLSRLLIPAISPRPLGSSSFFFLFRIHSLLFVTLLLPIDVDGGKNSWRIISSLPVFQYWF